MLTKISDLRIDDRALGFALPEPTGDSVSSPEPTGVSRRIALSNALPDGLRLSARERSLTDSNRSPLYHLQATLARVAQAGYISQAVVQ
ncbi:hypothetical protein HG15A2_08830 [Adhaeretor mobilis]|uniref:Uncharacterized protein n=1 Tax=Adhaeretor mobilis TaxID=1930276 RepID=A0A517MRV9_9BACT|nr:hypothetical protein HG15A2_08830 [Adhaeretor mobilis]